jgi:hypothetical protein
MNSQLNTGCEGFSGNLLREAFGVRGSDAPAMRCSIGQMGFFLPNA